MDFEDEFELPPTVLTEEETKRDEARRAHAIYEVRLGLEDRGRDLIAAKQEAQFLRDWLEVLDKAEARVPAADRPAKAYFEWIRDKVPKVAHTSECVRTMVLHLLQTAQSPEDQKSAKEVILDVEDMSFWARSMDRHGQDLALRYSDVADVRDRYALLLLGGKGLGIADEFHAARKVLNAYTVLHLELHRWPLPEKLRLLTPDQKEDIRNRWLALPEQPGALRGLTDLLSSMWPGQPHALKR